MYNLSYSQMEKIRDFFKKFIEEENINSSLILGIESDGSIIEMDIESLLEDTDVDALKNELEEVNDENDRLSDKIIDLKDEINDLKDEINDLKQRNEALEASNKFYKQTFEEIRVLNKQMLEVLEDE